MIILISTKVNWQEKKAILKPGYRRSFSDREQGIRSGSFQDRYSY